jgi:hypothetical protein
MYTAKRKDVPVDSAAFLRHKLIPATQVAQPLYMFSKAIIVWRREKRHIN